MSEDHFLNLQPGTIVNGRYEIVKCLGTGSMGMVYACRHRELSGHLVAMKVLFTEVARDNVAAARFRNEIVASYGVSHPNVVRAYEYFRDGDLVAFTMEYIGGGDLADRISSDLPLAIHEIVRMLSQMCSGVQAIHDAGIIHRDLKPENILVTAQGDIKITDFGIARCGAGPKLTEHGGVVGTIDYVSPEYLERGQVDARSDIYALGVLAYEMITGESPFKGKSVIETMTMRLRSDPEPPHRLRADCPIGLATIVLHAMSRDPERRYQRASEMLRDLQSIDLRSGVNGDFTAPAPELPPERSIASLVAALPVNEDRPLDDRDALLQGTVEIDAETVSYLSSNITRNTPHETFVSLGKMESVLASNKALSKAQQYPRIQPELVERASISVSHSALSAERMKELAFDLHADEPSILRTLVAWFIVIFIGFGVGILVLKHYFPQTLEQQPSTTVSGYE